jgi:hypothetical protein
MSSKLNRQDKPPASKEVLWVETVKGGQSQKFKVYSPTFYGVWVHYNPKPKGTKPCFEDHALCDGGHEEETLRWYAYLHCWSFKLGRQCFLQMTKAAAEMLQEQVKEGTTYRGLVIEVTRSAADNGRLTCRTNEWMTSNGKTMPQAMDPTKSLFHFWRVEQRVERLNHRLFGGEITFPEPILQSRVS